MGSNTLHHSSIYRDRTAQGRGLDFSDEPSKTKCASFPPCIPLSLFPLHLFLLLPLSPSISLPLLHLCSSLSAPPNTWPIHTSTTVVKFQGGMLCCLNWNPLLKTVIYRTMRSGSPLHVPRGLHIRMHEVNTKVQVEKWKGAWLLKPERQGELKSWILLPVQPEVRVLFAEYLAVGANNKVYSTAFSHRLNHWFIQQTFIVCLLWLHIAQCRGDTAVRNNRQNPCPIRAYSLFRRRWSSINTGKCGVMINAMRECIRSDSAAQSECSKCSINTHSFRVIFRAASLVGRQ